MTTRTHYQTLGIRPSASAAAVKRAFRDLARQLHPDVNAAPDATARFAEIQRAYEVLNDPKGRAEYDRKLGRLEHTPVPATDAVVTPHYSWTNVADRGSSVASADEVSDFDDLYQTFFAARARSEGKGKAKK